MTDCPKCKTPTLDRVSLGREARNLGSQPQRCGSCRGLWLQGHLEEAPTLLQILGDEPPPDSATDTGSEISTSSEASTQPDSRAGLCPEGHGILLRARVEGEAPFFLDRCPGCGGVWFDAGELARVAEEHLMGSLDVLWTSAWQRRQRERSSRKVYLEDLESLLGSDLLQSLMSLAEKMRASGHREQILAFLREESRPESQVSPDPPEDRG